MLITAYASADAFLAATQGLLEQHEAANNLMLGIALRLAQSPSQAAPPPYLATVNDEQGLVIAALMTPPHNLVVHSDRAAYGEAPALLLQHLLAAGYTAPGVLGPKPIARACAEAWSAASGRAWQPGMLQRVYELRQVSPIRYSPGRLRPAETADRDLVAAWAVAFHEEAGIPGTPGEVGEALQRRVAAGDVYVWEHGRPVSMAARSRPTRHGITVNLVYTPPELRRQGYATSCVAALSQRLLDSGYRLCTLFTDLANPTSNDIYQQIGYRPVCDFDEYVFL
ncbi:MAG TPA: GNAT family N-acetyltransferase [Anaerolineae bacterium]|nr:GNAT family N-acetyltransferase [Anaerolineae bacterium]